MALSSFLLGRNTSRRTVLRQLHGYSSNILVQAAAAGGGGSFDDFRFLSYSNKRGLTSSSNRDNKNGTTTGDGGEASNSRTSPRNDISKNRRKTKTERSAIPQVEQRFKKLKQKGYGGHSIFPFSSASGDGDGDGFQSNFIKPSQFLYSHVPDPATLPSSATSTGGGGSSSLERHVLYSIDASPFLDQSRYCKQARGTAQPYRDASRSIDGTSAARRLLYGKKNLTNCLVDWMAPELPMNGSKRHRPMAIPRQYLRLEGHGCPPDLFQHYINTGYAFLQFYGDHTESCSFHNFHNFDYHGQSGRRDSSSRSSSVLDQQQQQDAYPEDLTLYRRLIPQQVATRANNGSILACVKPPKAAGSDVWEHRMVLYLTAMERLVRELGGIMDKSLGRSPHYSHSNPTANADTISDKESVKQRKSKAQNSTPIQEYDYDQDDAEPSSSSHLFPSSFCWENPRWTVDILRRKELVLHPLDDNVRAIREGEGFKNSDEENPDPLPPFPIIELIPPIADHRPQSSSSMSPTTTSRRVSIRIQGYAMPDGEFWDTDLDRRSQSERFVSLVLNASPSPSFRFQDQHTEI